MPQGFGNSPTYFHEALKTDLDLLKLKEGTVILQYVDDILLSSPTNEQSEKDTVQLLRHLEKCGHKASTSKLQFVREKVIFLGHKLTKEGKTLSKEDCCCTIDS